MTRWSGAVLIGLGTLTMTGCGSESDSTTTAELPPDSVAVVAEAPDGAITEDDLGRALAQAATREGLRKVPASDDPQYSRLADAALSDLILSRWVLGEADERGIEAGEREIDQELKAVRQQQFGSEQEFQNFLDQSGFTLDEARERIALQLVSQQIQADVLPGDVDPTQQQRIAQDFQAEFSEKWRARTSCADEFVIDRCANGPPPTPGSESGLGLEP